MDIYRILERKSINNHYLKRYVNFIHHCIESNKNVNTKYIEKHHICPAGKTFFPEYTDLKQNPWNRADLTPRQHLIAHWMLAKSLGGYMWFALFMMTGGNPKTNKRSFRESRLIYELSRNKLKDIQRSREHRENLSKSKIGFTVYKDSEGNKYWLHKTDPMIKDKKLVGHTSGTSTKLVNKKHVVCKNIETGERVRVTKDEFYRNSKLVGIMKSHPSKFKNTKRLIKDNKRKRVPLYEVDSYLNDGWEYDKSQNGRESKAKGTVWMNNGEVTVRCEKSKIEYYKDSGFKRGRKMAS